MAVNLFTPDPSSDLTAARRWSGAHDAAASLAIENASRHHQGPLLVIAEDTRSADQIVEELAFFCDADTPIYTFPDWETLPYDSFSPHQDIISERLKALYHLPSLRRGILVVPVTTLMQRVAPRQFVLGNSLLLKRGQTIELQPMRHTLVSAGYHQVDTVYEHGEFAVRGAILDLFPMGSKVPYRIELFDEEIEQLRSFDPESQRTIERFEHLDILPAKEFPVNAEAIALFRQNWRARFEANPNASPVYQDVTSGIAPAGVEYYQPLFFSETATLFDYLPENCLILSHAGVETTSASFWTEIKRRYEDRRHDTERPLLAPEELWLATDEVFGAINRFAVKTLVTKTGGADTLDLETQPAPTFKLQQQAEQPLLELQDYLSATSARVLFCAESPGRREALLELLAHIGIHPTEFSGWQDFVSADTPTGITVAALDRGLLLAEPALLLISESQLFGQQVLQRRRRGKASDTSDQVIKNLAELNLNAPVVHLEHGVGRYRGLQTIEVDRRADEFLTLEYAAGAKLFVPIASLHLISRYAGADADTAPLHRLGSEKWQKAKRKAIEQIRDTAAELLDIHAQRAARNGTSFAIDEDQYQRFAAAFPFEETPDQAAAIAQTLKDMHARTAMDRLICGDVGFGKTEVAMRAAFVAASNGKQVAILVPTTLLAQQHYESFIDRFADWPITIDVLSRFRSREQQDSVLKRLADGRLDIVIGTHKLILGKIKFKDLGLLVIDEEHRFGVQQKEKIKRLRADVDILNLTATPIPRSLNMAMSGMRDISIIVSPPAKRLSIKTFIQRQEDSVRREAISRELLRGGQVYLLHNEVESIERKTDAIKELMPEARVAFAHGQMRERDLEKVMADFYHKRFNVLICSTIIETGIDIPAANTIIIERADRFGLAQLHQLRGRVGRSHHQAYAYLLIPNRKSVTADAIKRLEAIQEAQELGAGFTLASHDLEIRGAGELLGENQSGHIHAIGFSLYAELLEQAVASLKAGKTLGPDLALSQVSEINLHLAALIPETYLPDVHARLVMYKRIASAADAQQLRELQVEMIDRFGLLNDPIRNLIAVTELKLKAQALAITKLEMNAHGGKVHFAPTMSINPDKLIALIQSQPQRYKLTGASQLRLVESLPEPADRIARAHALLDQFESWIVPPKASGALS